MTAQDLARQDTATPQKAAHQPLLRPTQVEDLSDEIRAVDSQLSAPEYISSQIDKPAKAKQGMRLRKTLDEYTPQPFVGEELDLAVKVEETLRDQITTGMCTQEEMRRCPAGAPDKHASWEKRNKDDILSWKNIRLRLQASGVEFGGMGARSNNVANLELYRPSGGTQELPMHNQLVANKDFHNLHAVTGETTVFSDAELALIKAEFPDIYGQLSLLDNDQRAVIKAQVAALAAADVETPPEVTATADNESAATFDLNQHFFTLRKNVKDATGVTAKDKEHAIALIKEHGLK